MRQVLKHHKAKRFFVLNTSQSHFNLSKNSFYMLINSLLAFVNELELNSSLPTIINRILILDIAVTAITDRTVTKLLNKIVS